MCWIVEVVVEEVVEVVMVCRLGIGCNWEWNGGGKLGGLVGIGGLLECLGSGLRWVDNWGTTTTVNKGSTDQGSSEPRFFC